MRDSRPSLWLHGRAVASCVTLGLSNVALTTLGQFVPPPPPAGHIWPPQGRRWERKEEEDVPDVGWMLSAGNTLTIGLWETANFLYLSSIVKIFNGLVPNMSLYFKLKCMSGSVYSLRQYCFQGYQKLYQAAPCSYNIFFGGGHKRL